MQIELIDDDLSEIMLDIEDIFKKDEEFKCGDEVFIPKTEKNMQILEDLVVEAFHAFDLKSALGDFVWNYVHDNRGYFQQSE